MPLTQNMKIGIFVAVAIVMVLIVMAVMADDSTTVPPLPKGTAAIVTPATATKPKQITVVPKATVAPFVPRAKYVGCYKDNSAKRALRINAGRMTLNQCVDKAKAGKSNIIGFQAVDPKTGLGQCYLAGAEQNLGNAYQYGKGTCVKVIHPDTLKLFPAAQAGGTLTNAIYTIAGAPASALSTVMSKVVAPIIAPLVSKPEYVGCYKDDKNRVLDVQGTNGTLAQCFAQAQAKKAKVCSNTKNEFITI